MDEWREPARVRHSLILAHQENGATGWLPYKPVTAETSYGYRGNLLRLRPDPVMVTARTKLRLRPGVSYANGGNCVAVTARYLLRLRRELLWGYGRNLLRLRPRFCFASDRYPVTVTAGTLLRLRSVSCYGDDREPVTANGSCNERSEMGAVKLLPPYQREPSVQPIAMIRLPNVTMGSS